MPVAMLHTPAPLARPAASAARAPACFGSSLRGQRLAPAPLRAQRCVPWQTLRSAKLPALACVIHGMRTNSNPCHKLRTLVAYLTYLLHTLTCWELLGQFNKQSKDMLWMQHHRPRRPAFACPCCCNSVYVALTDSQGSCCLTAVPVDYPAASCSAHQRCVPAQLKSLASEPGCPGSPACA